MVRVVTRKKSKTGVLRNLTAIFQPGRLAGSGYLSILPADQEVEHSTGASFAPNPAIDMGQLLWAQLSIVILRNHTDRFRKSVRLLSMYGQANHLAATIDADIIKHIQAQNNGGYTALNYGKTDSKIYSELSSDHPVDLVRYPVACY